jgi:hypothetical protein
MLCRLELESLFYSYSYTLSLLKDCSLLLHGYRSNNLPSFGGAMTRLQGWLPQARKESTVLDQSLAENNSIPPCLRIPPSGIPEEVSSTTLHIRFCSLNASAAAVVSFLKFLRCSPATLAIAGRTHFSVLIILPLFCSEAHLGFLEI